MNHNQQPNNSTSPSSPNRALQALKSTISTSRGSVHSLTAPSSPMNLSPKHGLLSPASLQFVQTASAIPLLFPARSSTEGNEHSKADLFANRANTDSSEVDETGLGQIDNKLSLQNFQKLVNDMKNGTGKRSKSVKKSSKASSPASNVLRKSPNRMFAESVPISDKELYSDMSKKRARNGAERINKSVGGEILTKMGKKALNSAIKSLELDLGINQKLVTESEGPESLFYEGLGLSDKDTPLKDLVPVRYSKMSEEDAATMFETRRKELLSFLLKLGANSAQAKKKFASKTAALIKQAPTSVGQSSDLGSKERGIRLLQEPLKDKSLLNRFIVYNATTEATGNNAKFGTPAKEGGKKLASFLKAGCESAPDGKRRNSTKLFRDKEELNNCVERNLEASFNQIASDWYETSAKKSPSQAKKKGESLRKSIEDKGDAIENIIIDLTKTKLKKKKRERKMEEEEKVCVAERVFMKQLSEDMTGSLLRESRELVRSDVNISLKPVENIKKKTLVVLNEIEEIDLQIQQLMKSDGNGGLSQRAKENKESFSRKRVENQKDFYLESLQEGYSYAAQMKKNADRSRSLSLRNSLHEPAKPLELRKPENNRIEEAVKPVVENNPLSLSKNSKSEVQVNAKETKGKILNRPTSQSSYPKLDSINESDKRTEKQSQSQKRSGARNSNVVKTVHQESKPNLTTFTKSQSHMAEIKLKTLDLGKGSFVNDQNGNPRASQTTTNKTTKFPSKLDFKEIQAPVQRLKGKSISKPFETAPTLQSVRDNLLSCTSSPKEMVLLGARNTGSSMTTPLNRNLPLNNFLGNKPLITYKKPQKSLTVKSSQRSIFAGEFRSESIDLPDLFENQSPVQLHEPSTPVPKIPFSDGVRNTQKENASQKVTNPKPKPVQNKDAVKSLRESQPKIRKGEVNRPTFDSSATYDLRARIFGDARNNSESGVFIKMGLSPKSFTSANKLELKQTPSEGNSVTSINKGVRPGTKKLQKQGSFLRKGSTSTPRGFILGSFLSSNEGSTVNSLQDLESQKTQRSHVELKEKCVNIVITEYPAKNSKRTGILKQNENSKHDENVHQMESAQNKQHTKEFLTLKRKKMAGYSLC